MQINHSTHRDRILITRQLLKEGWGVDAIVQLLKTAGAKDFDPGIAAYQIQHMINNMEA